MAQVHCKDPKHLQLAVMGTAHTSTVTATYLASAQCEHSVQSWVVVLSKKPGLPLNGMHLLPTAVAWLPDQLRAHATEATDPETVLLSHTFDQVFRAFCSLTPSAADELATAIEQAKGS